jgi:glycyl-tRNA synthetase beta chain
VEESAIFIQETDKGKFLAVKYIKTGYPQRTFTEVDPDMILQIPFDKKCCGINLFCFFASFTLASNSA